MRFLKYQLDAISRWFRQAEYVEDLVHLTHEGHRHLAALPEIFQDIADEPTLNSMRVKADRAQRERDDGFWMLHSHSLMGLWGYMEVLIQDLLVNELLADPTLYEGGAFDKIKLPVAKLASDDRESLAIFVSQEVVNVALTGTAPGRFEKVLKFVRLDGVVPQQVSQALYNAHQIRNVCAHKSGLADEYFVKMCPNVSVNVGERVPLSIEEFAPLMHGLHMYGVILLNRMRAKSNKPLLKIECHGYQGTQKEAFPDGQFQE